MDKKLILMIATYILLALDVASIFLRKKRILSSAGELKMKLKSKVKIVFILIYAFCFALPAVIFFRNFSFLYSVTFCLVAVLGCEVTTRDTCTLGINGVYQNCVVIGDTKLYFDDIVSFPILELPEEEQEHYDHHVLIAASRLKGNVNLIFQTEEECRAATALIRELSGK